MKKIVIAVSFLLAGVLVKAQLVPNPASNHGNRFERIDALLPTPNAYRTASGAPGPKYWQQQCDYDIKASLDEEKMVLTGEETVTYYNNSPDHLTYLWLQLDENEHSNIRNANYQSSTSIENVNPAFIDKMLELKNDNGYGVNITSLTDANGHNLPYTINRTMMRIELPQTLGPGQKFVFICKWNYRLADRLAMGGRGGYELFPDNGNALFTMTQWYPRLCVYSDVKGWQNNQFTGRGEFALTFGNFRVEIDVPADHVVGATGECINYEKVLSAQQLQRLKQAQNVGEPIEIVRLDEAVESEKKKLKSRKRWMFKADNVRDFAWTSSRKYVWDAMAVNVGGNKVMCMSFYGKEAYPLYRKYSTKVVAHTIQTYSSFTLPYPYPVAQSVEAANGMEYPMICFNYGRTDVDGTYTEATKNGMIGVIIHEVGHNFFPMIVNSDERQWSWMDEGLNTYLQFLTEQLFDNKFPSRRGPAWAITDYMRLPKDQLEPIMTNSENIIQFGPNAYAKPATGLNILRETIVGRELFDYAFKTYAKRWAFRHPEPADFFRTIQDASAEDLNWFWKGWFFTTDAVDIAIDSVKHYVYDATVPFRPDPEKVEIQIERSLSDTYDDVTKQRNRSDSSIQFLTDKDTTLRDFYWRYARNMIAYDSSKLWIENANASPGILSEDQGKKYSDLHFYEVHFSNVGGMVMPLIVQFVYDDGTTETEKIPAQIWRKNERHVSKLFITKKRVASIVLDPLQETADINTHNNRWPQMEQPSRFQLFKSRQQARGQSEGLNPMQYYQSKPELKK